MSTLNLKNRFKWLRAVPRASNQDIHWYSQRLFKEKWRKTTLCLPLRKHICTELLGTSALSALSNMLARLSCFSCAMRWLLSSTTTTGENSPRRNFPTSVLSAISHSRQTTELLDRRRSSEFQWTLLDCRMCALEKARNGLQSSTMQASEDNCAEPLRIGSSSLPVISHGSLFEIMAEI